MCFAVLHAVQVLSSSPSSGNNVALFTHVYEHFKQKKVLTIFQRSASPEIERSRLYIFLNFAPNSGKKIIQ